MRCDARAFSPDESAAPAPTRSTASDEHRASSDVADTKGWHFPPRYFAVKTPVDDSQHVPRNQSI
jgi:hypothetical protein